MSDNKPISEPWIDRLVDGELSADEYRLALQRLETQPDGWRQCALGFLEAQALRSELTELSQREPPRPTVQPVAAVVHPWRRWGGSLAACAASFALAFGLAREFLPAPAPAHPTVDHVANRQESPAVAPASREPDHAPHTEKALGRYQLVVDGPGGPQLVEVPVYAADDPRAQFLLEQPAPVAPELVRVLEETGNRVQQQRNWIPVSDADGRAVYFPVDEVRVTPVTSRSFQ